jgi:Flp pilus assembly pilin Flp
MINRLAVWLANARSSERGQDLIEYAMLGGFIAAGIVAVLVSYTPALNALMGGIGNCIDFTPSTACTPGF